MKRREQEKKKESAEEIFRKARAQKRLSIILIAIDILLFAVVIYQIIDLVQGL
ncbi:MAG: hypothetical protein ACOX6L_12340 [Syntrophomonadaceae bacterium]|jgi:hypothetical protein